jgi:hypothetical protein
VQVNQQPHFGTFTCTPSTGIEQTTEIVCSCDGWEDAEGDLPLTCG